MLDLVVSLEPDLAQKVEPEEGECHDPDGEVDFPVEDAPVVGLVGNAEELESECHFNESENYLHGIEPASALELLEQGREHCENRERQGECHREGQHCHHRCPEFTLGGLDEDGAYYRSGAGE